MLLDIMPQEHPQIDKITFILWPSAKSSRVPDECVMGFETETDVLSFPPAPRASATPMGAPCVDGQRV